MKSSIRNLVIFCVIALGGGYLGAAIDRSIQPADSMQGPGVLLFLVSPVLAVLLLRAFGGDGWKDFGLGLNLRAAWKWHLAGVGIPLLATGLALVVGAASGVLSVSAGESGWAAFLPLAGVTFASVAVKNLFEEFAWRGYLTPRFAALRLHPFASALLTGFIWAAWHIPYYLFFLPTAELTRYTSLPVAALLALAFVALPFHSLAYGELRLLSKSTWTAWLMHSVANAVSMPLLSGGFVLASGGLTGAVFSPGTEGIVHSLAMGAVGLGLYFVRKSRS